MNPILETLINLLFPQKCWNCRSFCNDIFCADCLKQIIRCQPLNFPQDAPLSRIIAFGKYRGILEKIIKKFKFHHHPELAKNLAWLLFRAWRESDDVDDEKEILLEPVPLYFQKEKERGFNQSLLLAQELGKITGFKINQNLVKIKETPPLYELSRSQRLKILKNAFWVMNNRQVAGREIILIDDIFTTGATLFNAALTLKKAGAKKVIGLVIAVA